MPANTALAPRESKTKYLAVTRKKSKFLKQFPNSPYISNTCKILDISPNQVGYWRRTDADFNDKLKAMQDEFRQIRLDNAEETVHNGIGPKNV